MNYAEYLKLKQFVSEQRELFRYQQYRELPRPNVLKVHLVLLAILFLIVLTIEIVLPLIFIKNVYIKVSIILFCVLLTIEFYTRFFGIMFVKCYQHYAKEETRRSCLCKPSCSEYAIICFKKFELIKALLKIRKRLKVTCRGTVYKIDNP